MNPANQHVIGIIEQLGSTEFWGTLAFKFQRGRVIHITKEESIQPEPENRRSYDRNSKANQ